jgi:hypothetical protein
MSIAHCSEGGWKLLLPEARDAEVSCIASAVRVPSTPAILLAFQLPLATSELVFVPLPIFCSP